jgi:hypothetical protein
MPDYRVKISETQDEERECHHYLVTAKDEERAGLAKLDRCISEEIAL